MPIGERDQLGPGFEWRLKAVLDRVVPPPRLSSPRYQSASVSFRRHALAPALLAIAMSGLLALSATAATGSPNPAVWEQKAATTIHSVSHAQSSPATDQKPSPAATRATGGAQVAPAPRTLTHAVRPEGSPTPEPSGRHHESSWPVPTASPHHDEGPSESQWGTHKTSDSGGLRRS
jgi:hypothetical protein